MKRPTITKLQTINALIELKRRDHDQRVEDFKLRRTDAERALLTEMGRVITDPARVAALLAVNPEQHEGDEPLDLCLTGKITLDALLLPEVAELKDQLGAVYKTNPRHFDEGTTRTLLEDKLTGCDPESLLSVPDNVATMRALLNGLLLLPESCEALSQ